MSYEERCRNMNHSRTNAPVRFCPQCGDIVNNSAVKSCNEAKHAQRRKEAATFCTDCGKKLR